MNLINKKEIKMKSGIIIAAASNCEVTFNHSTVCGIKANNTVIKLNCSSLPRYFDRFKHPSMAALEKYSNDGVAKSILGNRVEPDGYDDQGSPSWLLAIGII
jgi:hypothetical protein